MTEQEIFMMQSNDNTTIEVPRHTLRDMLRGKVDRLWESLEATRFQDSFEGLSFEEDCPFE
jgi:hypothetical protein